MEEPTYTAVEVVETPETEPETPKQKKPKKRSFEELKDVRPEKMTERERIEYIKRLREENQLLQNKNTELDVTCQKAFTLYKTAEEARTQMKNAINKYLRQIHKHVQCHYEDLTLILEKGVNINVD